MRERVGREGERSGKGERYIERSGKEGKRERERGGVSEIER